LGAQLADRLDEHQSRPDGTLGIILVGSEARDLLAPIYGWFTEGFDTPVLQDVKALHRDGIATATRLACWIVGRLKRGVNRRRCCSVASNLVLSGSHTELCGVDTKQSTYDLR